MKSFKMKSFIILLITSVIFNVFMSNKTIVMANLHSEIVIDFQSGRILSKQNENQKRLIASTTKIATAITAIENCDINKSVIVKKEWCNIEGSSVYLKEGENYTIEQLLYGLMLRSGNDCAVCIANSAMGDNDTFIKKMNEIAKLAGAYDTNFCNPHGLDADEHYSTAKDLAFITRYALRNECFKKIVGSKKYSFTSNGQTTVWYNKNKLLANYTYAIGVKTGYTKRSGRCLVSAAEKDGQILICVILGYGPTYERTEQLFDESFNNYKYAKLLNKDESVAQLLLDDGSSVPCYVKEDFYYPLRQSEVENVEYVVNFDKNIKIPLKFEQNVGTIQILLEKQLLFEQKIYTII